MSRISLRHTSTFETITYCAVGNFPRAACVSYRPSWCRVHEISHQGRMAHFRLYILVRESKNSFRGINCRLSTASSCNATSDLDKPLRLWALLPTMTVPKDSGLPHSFVVSACRSSSPVLKESVSWLFPGAGISPALAACLSAFSQAEIFAEKPSGLFARWRDRSE